MVGLVCSIELGGNRALMLEDLAHQLEAMPLAERFDTWSALPLEDKAGTLAYFHTEPCRALVDASEEADLLALGLHLSGGELADIFEVLPERTLELIVAHLDQARKSEYQALSQYQSNQLGRYLSQELLVTPQSAALARIRRLVGRKHIPYVQHVYRVDRNNQFLDAIYLVDLFGVDEYTPAELIDKTVMPLPASLDIVEAINLLQASGWSALPVVDDQNRLLGVFTMATAMMAQREQTESMVLSTAGIDEQDDLFSPILSVAKDRGIWLGINLATAILASLFIAMFEDSLAEIVALAVLMPLVASMGGITGSQTLSTVIRRMALGQITDENQALIMRRELAVGVCNGVLWAIVGSILAGIWFTDMRVAIALAVGLSVNISIAAWAGMVIPLLLKRMGIDPAISGAVILTTVTDIVGFVSFLGTATVILSLS